MLSLFVRPFQAPAIWLLVAWTLIGRFLALLFDIFVDYAPMAKALVVGFLLPVWYVLLGSLGLYAQKHLLHLARGLNDEPIDQVTDLNPFQDSLAFQLCLLLLIPAGVAFTYGPLPNAAQLIVPTLIFPLLWLGLMLEGSLIEALHPATLWRIVSGLNIFYLPVALIVSASVGFAVYAIFFWHDMVAFAGAGYLLLLGHSLAAKILYWRRGPLYLHTLRSPEQDHAEELQNRHAELRHLFEELHQLCGAGRIKDAHEKLDAHIDGEYEEMDPFIHERLLEFQDTRLMLQHAVFYLQRLLESDKTLKAWALFKSCLAMDDRFRPMDDTALLKLTGAASRQDAVLVDEVLSDFPSAYPDSGLIPAVKFRRARVLIELLGNAEAGHAIIREIAEAHAEFAAGARYRNYRSKQGIH